MFVFQITWVIFHSISPKRIPSPLTLKLVTVLLAFLNNSSSDSSHFIFLFDFLTYHVIISLHIILFLLSCASLF